MVLLVGGVLADRLSRVSAYDHLGSIALAPLGIVLAGFLFKLVGSRTTLLLAAAIIIVPTAAVLLVADCARCERRASSLGLSWPQAKQPFQGGDKGNGLIQ